MDEQQIQEKRRQLEQLRQQVKQLEDELAAPRGRWQATQFYWAYFATTGFMLGMFAAASSLLLNVVGSVLVQQHPLRLIQIYLTFPLGEEALTMDTGLALAIGCCLYLGTGMLLGIPFQLVLGWFDRDGTRFARRLLISTGMGVVIWLINYYALLSWLQPLLFQGNWIVSEVPAWVACLTHVVFGWTMALLYPFGLYTPYRLQTEQS